MADAPLQQILDELRTRIQAELDGQVEALRVREAEEVARAREEAAAEAEQLWAAKVEAVKSEWAARLESEAAAVRAEAEKRLVEETMRIRSEADQAVAVERERGTAELDAERQRRATELDAERERAGAQLDEERRRIEQQLAEVGAAFELERDQLERDVRARQAAGVDAERVLGALRTIDAAHSLSDALSTLVRAAARHAPRVGLFILNGTRLDEWSASGVEPLTRQPIDLEQSGLLRAAVTRGSRVSAPGDASAPSFAVLPEGRAASAVPLMLDGVPIAVLYADEGPSESGPERHGWADAVELLARHGAACLAQLTAVRSLQVLHGESGPPRATVAPADEDQSARRYAKLLVSEIKLYNEGAVRVGRERRDLLQRLKAEIERARRLYENRVSPTVSARGSYFQQELIQTLAGGDPALLGS